MSGARERDVGPGPTRVLLVDDSATLRSALTALLERAGVRVIATAADGEEAVRAAALLRPDVVLMDVRMPRLDGLQATQRIMARTPVPILLMTAPDNLTGDVGMGLRALECGALELIPKPDLIALQQGGVGKLVSQLRLLAGVPVIPHMRGRREAPELFDSGAQRLPARPTTFHKRAKRVIGVVSSTGGPRALLELLQRLPADLPAAVVVVQHIDPAFQEGLARWLEEETPLRVALPGPDEDLHASTVYLAPQGKFAEVTPRRRIALREEPCPSGGHCPSGDRLLASLADAYGPHAIGVVLTGIGSDGAEGLLRLRRAGGHTLAQDEASSVVWGMPRAAIERGAAERVLPLLEIPTALLGWLQ